MAEKVIENIKSFADLEPDWDTYGALPISKKVIDKALELAEKLKPDWACPIASNGICLLWHKENWELEIDINRELEFGYLLVRKINGKSVDFNEKNNISQAHAEYMARLYSP